VERAGEGKLAACGCPGHQCDDEQDRRGCEECALKFGSAAGNLYAAERGQDNRAEPGEGNTGQADRRVTAECEGGGAAIAADEDGERNASGDKVANT